MEFAISSDGTKIAYETQGSGPALIYIAGAICHRKFQPILDDVKAFADHFKVYSFDRRGRGDSSDNHNSGKSTDRSSSPDYTPQSEVEDIRAIIDLAGGNAFLYGHSSGAVLALETALAYPDKVKKVIAYDTPYSANDQEKHQFLQTETRIKTLITQLRYSAALDHFLISIGTPWIMAQMMRLIPGWKKSVQLAPTLLYDIELTKNLPPLERLNRLTVPILLAVGEKSPSSIHHVSTSIANSVTGSQFQVVAKQDHMVDARALIPIMNQFFVREESD